MKFCVLRSLAGSTDHEKEPILMHLVLGSVGIARLTDFRCHLDHPITRRVSEYPQSYSQPSSGAANTLDGKITMSKNLRYCAELHEFWLAYGRSDLKCCSLGQAGPCPSVCRQAAQMI